MRTKKQTAANPQEVKAVRELAFHLANIHEFLQNRRHTLPADMREDADRMARYIALETGDLCFDLSLLLK